jgi:hypothetical protein
VKPLDYLASARRWQKYTSDQKVKYQEGDLAEEVKIAMMRMCLALAFALR